MDKTGKYLYGITDAPQNQIAEIISNLKGINDEALRAVSYQDITALVSDTSIINFDGFDKEELRQHITTHQQTVEVLAKNMNIIPMRFGMIVKEEKELLNIFKRAYLQFTLALNKISDKAEFILQVLWDEQAFLEEIGASGNFGKEEGAGLVTKLKLGKIIFELVEKHRKQYIADVQTDLKKVVLDIRSSKLASKNMILNQSLLIKRDQESKLDEIINKLSEQYGKLQFKYFGPLPIYSFVDIDLNLGDFELVERARETLQLPEEASLFDIKQTYRRLALSHHPDKRGSEEEMKRLGQAYEILENYCRNYVYSFKEDDIQKIVINKSEKFS